MIGTGTSSEVKSRWNSATFSRSASHTASTAKHSPHHTGHHNHKGHNQDMEALATSSSSSTSVSNSPSRETPSRDGTSGGSGNGSDSGSTSDNGTSKKGGDKFNQKNSDSNGDHNSGNGNDGSNYGGSAKGLGQGFAMHHCQPHGDNEAQFTGAWVANVSLLPVGAAPLTFTSRTSVTPGTQASIQFNGTKIMIMGQIHKSNGGAPPAMAVYTIDRNTTANSIELPLPISNMDIPLLSFFTSPNLPYGTHSLDINVTAVSAQMPYTVNGFIICDSGAGSPAADLSGFSHGKPHPKGLSPGAIAGIVIGCVAFVLLIVFGCFLFRRRQRNMRSARTADSPITRWLERRMSGTLFTSSTSIMRATPSDHSAVAVPPFDQISTLEKSDDGYYPRSPTEMSSRSITPQSTRSSHRPAHKPVRSPSILTLPSFGSSNRSIIATEVTPPVPAKLHPT